MIVRNTPEAIIEKRGVHPDDAEVLKDGYQKLFNGEDKVEFYVERKIIWVDTTLRTFMHAGSDDIICFAYSYDRTNSENGIWKSIVWKSRSR